MRPSLIIDSVIVYWVTRQKLLANVLNAATRSPSPLLDHRDPCQSHVSAPVANEQSASRLQGCLEPRRLL